MALSRFLQYQYTRWLLLIVIANASIAAAQVSVGKTDSIYSALPATPDGIHIRFRKDHWERLNLASGTIEQHHIPGIGGMTQYYQPILLQQGLFLVHELGGLVYRVNEDSIWRIDKSFDHRMQNHSIIFQRNDTILRHGGYGFWSARQLIVYFDIASGNWEPYRYKPGATVPPGFSGHQYILKGDSLLILGGLIYDPSDPLVPKPNDQVWCYQFSALEWTYLGNADWANMGYSRSKNIRTLEVTPNRFLISDVEALSVDPERNLIGRHQLADQSRFWFYLPHVAPFVWNSRIYFYRHKPQIPNQHELCYIPANTLLGTPVEEHEWIKPVRTIQPWMTYTASITLVLISALAVFRKKLIRLKSHNALSYNKFELESIEARLIEAFLPQYPKNLLVAEIDAALDTSRKSRDVQNQRRSQVIRSVNSKFMVYAQTDSPLILTKRSETDGRMVEYFIDPILYPTLLHGLGKEITN